MGEVVDMVGSGWGEGGWIERSGFRREVLLVIERSGKDVGAKIEVGRMGI